MGCHLSPRYGQVILVSGYPVLKAVNWSQRGCAISIRLHLGSQSSKKVWDITLLSLWSGRTVVRWDGWCTVTWLPKFLLWIDFLTHGAQLRALRALESSAVKKFPSSSHFENWEKFENSIKIHFLFAKLLQISTILKEAVQARKSSYWLDVAMHYQLPKTLRLHKNELQNKFCNIVIAAVRRLLLPISANNRRTTLFRFES